MLSVLLLRQPEYLDTKCTRLSRSNYMYAVDVSYTQNRSANQIFKCSPHERSEQQACLIDISCLSLVIGFCLFL